VKERYGLKYVPTETEFQSFVFEFLNLNHCIEKLNPNCIV